MCRQSIKNEKSNGDKVMCGENKQILFVCYGLDIGGIEKCLVNLLNIMPDQYDIDVLLMNPYYTFKKQIKRNICFLNEFDYVMNIEDTLHEIKNRGGILRNLGMFLSYCIFRLRIKLRKDAWIGFKKMPKKYDVAIAYSHHDFSPYYVIDKVDAKKKCLWYHNGAYEQQGNRYERDKKYYALFDKVVAVSSDCAKVLNEKFEFRDGQLIVLKNICDASDILTKATEKIDIPFEQGYFHIVTVGRMTAEKGAVMAVAACKQICNKGYKIRWHWIGDGNQMNDVKEEINKSGVDNAFILEGNKENPYPYIRSADLYVQPSFYEAYSTTITEAKVLQKPIIATDVGGMRDQLAPDENGLIVPGNPTDLANAVISLIENSDKRQAFCNELSKEDFSPDNSFRSYEEHIFS